MDKNIKIQLNSKKHVNSVNIDTFNKIQLNNNNLNHIYDKDLRRVISETEVFENERERSNKYRLYGTINYLSLLNGIGLDYEILSDYFREDINPFFEQTRNLINSFDVYVVKPSSEHYNYGIRKFDVVATPTDIDIFPVAYAKNIFNNNNYCYVVSLDQNIENQKDFFNLPITDLFLYFQYKPTTSTANSNLTEKFFIKNIGNDNLTEISGAQYHYSVGDVISYGDLVSFDYDNFELNIIENRVHVIETKYPTLGSTANLRWSYDCFYRIPLRYYSNSLTKINKHTKSQEDLDNIPWYGKENSNGYITYRNLLPHGEFDPVTEQGVDFPFVNGFHYVFSDIVFDVTPFLVHSNTNSVFSNINFGEPISQIIKNNNIDNINPDC